MKGGKQKICTEDNKVNLSFNFKQMKQGALLCLFHYFFCISDELRCQQDAPQEGSVVQDLEKEFTAADEFDVTLCSYPVAVGGQTGQNDTQKPKGTTACFLHSKECHLFHESPFIKYFAKQMTFA